jgi:hypothetical protein
MKMIDVDVEMPEETVVGANGCAEELHRLDLDLIRVKRSSNGETDASDYVVPLGSAPQGDGLLFYYRAQPRCFLHIVSMRGGCDCSTGTTKGGHRLKRAGRHGEIRQTDSS